MTELLVKLCSYQNYIVTTKTSVAFPNKYVSVKSERLRWESLRRLDGQSIHKSKQSIEYNYFIIHKNPRFPPFTGDLEQFHVQVILNDSILAKTIHKNRLFIYCYNIWVDFYCITMSSLLVSMVCDFSFFTT